MRYIAILAALSSFATVALTSTPSIALERIGSSSSVAFLVTRVAERPTITTGSTRHRVARGYDYYRPSLAERAYANRWIHFQYVNAGYPVRHYGLGIYYEYVPSTYCCRHHRHW